MNSTQTTPIIKIPSTDGRLEVARPSIKKVQYRLNVVTKPIEVARINIAEEKAKSDDLETESV